MASRDILDELISRSTRGPLQLYRAVTRCPSCGSYALEITEYMYSVPYFGNIILSIGTCSSCGYKYRDVRLAEATEPKKIIVKVEGEREVRYLLIKSAMAIIYIPERGYEMLPGPASTGFITTIEGLLHRFLEVLEILCKDKPDNEVCSENREWLKNAIEGKQRFTLIICDNEGTSKVIGDNVIVTEIDEECREKTQKL
ncbi:MAG: ZPR1 zinc finger domain-containing protein [Desulfurococcales archaeon]|nr:ZPR1 zinc finger domain-containing protein [Desulfurococcales archaeon]